jgi:hypothetical protein
MFNDNGITMAGVISSMDSNPLSLMIDLHMIRALGNTNILADVLVRNGVKVSVFAYKYIIVLLYFCFCVMLNIIGSIRRGLQKHLFLTIKQLLSDEYLPLKVDLAVLIQFILGSSKGSDKL